MLLKVGRLSVVGSVERREAMKGNGEIAVASS